MMGDKHLKWRKEVPECCKKCKRLDFDSADEYSPSYYFCTLGLFLPVKKESCKKQSKYVTKNEIELVED